MEQEQFKKDILPLRNRIFAYSSYLMKDEEEAADITQEVFLKLWFIRKEIIKYRNIEALSIKITKNLCLNRLKERKREIENTGADYETDTPHIRLERKDNLDHVIRIIDTLPGLQQSILRMKHIEGLEVEEIAALTGSSAEAVRMNLSRARKKVKELFFKIEKNV